VRNERARQRAAGGATGDCLGWQSGPTWEREWRVARGLITGERQDTLQAVRHRSHGDDL
jgi:hypothetical protein